MIRLIDKNQDAIDVPLDLLPIYFQFAKDGKRLYEDNVDILVLYTK